MQIKSDENLELGSCGCGRSPTGYCIGWHTLEEDDFRKRLAQYENTQTKAFENKNR
jgi:hypothetical protein